MKQLNWTISKGYEQAVYGGGNTSKHERVSPLLVVREIQLK